MESIKIVTKKTFTLLALAFVLFSIFGNWPVDENAPHTQAAITGVIGNITNGSSITINGSGFGTKSNSSQSVPAAPLIWDITSEQYIGGQNRNAYVGIANGSTINTNVWQLINFAGNGDTARLTTSRAHRTPF